MSKGTGNNRVSALKRLSATSQLNNINRGQLAVSKSSVVQDARELLTNRNQSSFDARQLLSRKMFNTSTDTIVRKNVLLNKEEMDNNSGKVVVVTGLKDMKMKDGRLIPTPTTDSIQTVKKKQIFSVGPSTFVTIRNNNNNNNNNNTNISSIQSTEKISLTKTIKNPSAPVQDKSQPDQTVNSLLSLHDRKVAISFVNDKYKKTLESTRATTASPSLSSSTQSLYSPPVIKRLHDASIQTASSSTSSRSPIRMNSHRRHTSTTTDDEDRLSQQINNDDDGDDDDDDFYEPPVKRTSSSARKTTSERAQQSVSTAMSTGSVKRTSTGAPVSSRIASNTSTVVKSASTTQSSSIPGTILVTNLQPSVTEEDVIELFGDIGRINQITTLSQGCVQVVYDKREDAEQAVTKYHNRLLDGQFMYVSLQQPSSYSTKQSSKTTTNSEQTTKEKETSNNFSSTTDQPLKLNSTNSNSKKFVIDPAFIRQALFQPSNNTTNPVQFQVKL